MRKAKTLLLLLLAAVIIFGGWKLDGQLGLALVGLAMAVGANWCLVCIEEERG